MIVPCFLVAFLERQKRASLFCSPPRQRRVKAAACESVRLSFFTVPRPFFCHFPRPCGSPRWNDPFTFDGSFLLEKI